MSGTRPLSYLERYQLSRINVGVPATVCFTALLRVSADPAHQHLDNVLAQAVQVLLKRYPILGCKIAGVRTTSPKWTTPDSPLEASQVIGNAHDDFPPSARTDTSSVISAAFDVLSRVEPEKGPLWRVWAFKDDEEEEIPTWRIVYATNHSLADGTGARNLFADLLKILHTPDTPTPNENEKQNEIAPAMESHFDLSSSYLDMVRLIYSEFLLPRLPSFLRPAHSTPFHRKPLVPPYQQKTAIRTLTLPASLVAELKTASKARGVATLHPVLYIAGLAAVEAHKFPSDSVVVGSTPASVRALEASLPYATGNYVYEIHVPHHLDNSAESHSFWSTCASYAQKLVDPQTRITGLKGIGSLSLVPDGPLPSSSSATSPSTKYDAWMMERSRKEEPFETTFEVSNLGVLPLSGWEDSKGLKELVWAQTAMTGTIFAINPIAIRGGDLAFTLTYRAGTVEESLVDRIWTSYERILRDIAAGQVPAGSDICAAGGDDNAVSIS
ncbi:hypothetical protein JCM10908_006892 [Rhodotorula pacifica]|uniref:uncharacterized protein n=1 Tax=Rhodotorula pacifica TaxID=1495444 RepID=UPI003171A510